jgi:hypothetical protein
MNVDFSKLCTPAKIYFAIAVIACVVALVGGLGIIAVFMKLVFAFIWTFILAWLCSKGYKSLSWFLVLLPYIIILLGLVGLMRLTSSQRNMLNSIKLQGPFGQENFTNNAMMKPGMKQPGMMQPGMMQPGMTKPNMMKSGMMKQ